MPIGFYVPAFLPRPKRQIPWQLLKAGERR
jgi:hypothetical protein